MAGNSLIGNLAILLSMDTAAFEKGNTHAQKLLAKTQRQFEQMGKKIAGVGKTMSLAITAPLVGFGAVAVREATEAAHAMGQVEAALKSMGPVAGKTAAELKKAADAFETQSLFESDEILTKVTANLLTFGNVAGTQFDRAQQAAINLSARLGQDLQSSAIQVGKALNDPVKGISALRRVGIQFTAAQTAQIKALVAGGQAAKAQGIILSELERQFGGAAQAAQDTDPYNKMTDAFKQMAETVGTQIIKSRIIESFTSAITTLVSAFSKLSPETQKFIIISAGIAAAVGPLLIVLGSFVSILGTLLPLLLKVGPAFLALQKAFLAVRLAALATLPALTPFLIPLGLITAAVVAGYLAWKNWDKIKAIVASMVGAVRPYFETLKKIILALIHPIDTVIQAFRSMYDKIVGHSYVPDMVDEIGAQMARLDAIMVAPVNAATGKAAQAFRALQESTKGLLDRLFPEAAALNTFKAEIETLEAAMKKGILTAEEYAAALSRLKMEGMSEEPIDVASQGPLITEATAEDIANASADMNKIFIVTRDWSKLINTVAKDLGTLTGEWLASFVEGSAKLKDLWKTILAYAIRFFTNENSPFMSLFGGARASGGPVQRGSTYLVGEEGPELFSPRRSGHIVSNDNLRGSSGTVNQYFDIRTPDANSFRKSQRQITREQKRSLARQ